MALEFLLNNSEKNSSEVRLGDFVEQINREIPFDRAESWDKVGLLIGDPDSLISQVILTLDVTEQTLEFARTQGANLIIAHHPIIFSPLATLREDQPEQALIRSLIHLDVAVIALHTNLDAVDGGTADALADALDLSERERSIFEPQPVHPEFGHGRVIDLQQPILVSGLRLQATHLLGSSGVRINSDRDFPVQKIAVFPGSFDESWVSELVEQEVEAIVTGEIKHHVGLMLAMRGIAALDVGHDVSERVVLPRLLHRLKSLQPDLSFAVDYGFDYNKMTF